MGAYVPAKYFGAVRGEPTLIVIHSMESEEKGDTAESVARYFQNPSTPSSAHVCIDNNSEIDCVPRNRVAYAAPGANHNGFHIEMAGRARQSLLEWSDDYSRAVVLRSASRAADTCLISHVWPVYRSAADLKKGICNGITTHNDVSDAYGKSSHWDPGPHFPIKDFCDLVKAIVQKRQGVELPPVPTVAQQPVVAKLQEVIFYTKVEAGRNPLKEGDGKANGRDAFVKILQNGLNLRGAKLAVDGEFGPATAQTVRWVQSLLGFEATGQAHGEFLNYLYP